MNIPLIHPNNILTFIKPSGGVFSLNIGDIVTAKVLKVSDSGNVLLRLTPNNLEGFNITAKSNIPLTNGDIIRLKVIGGGKEIQLQFAGKADNAKSLLNPTNKYTPAKIFEIMSDLSTSRLKTADIRLLSKIISALPDNIKNAFPDFKAIEQLMPEIQKLNNMLLKSAVLGSGVIFETRLRFALLHNSQQNEDNSKDSLLFNISSLETDQKFLLMRIKEALKNDNLLRILKASGLQASDIANTVDKLLKNIEFFQLTSYLNEVLYTFLPVSWQEMINGELLFRKNDLSGELSYSCDINLDLETIGKLSISVTLFKNDFYITFQAEKPETIALIISEKRLIEKAFFNAGLSLKIINTSRRHELNFETSFKKGINVHA